MRTRVVIGDPKSHANVKHILVTAQDRELTIHFVLRRPRQINVLSLGVSSDISNESEVSFIE